MNTNDSSAPAAGSRLRNIFIPLIVSGFCVPLATKPKAESRMPVKAVPIAQPNFWLIDDDEKIRPVARLPVLSSL